jgi:IS30 family transposase
VTGDTTIVRGRAEIAHRLGRSERTVSRWLRRGLLPACKNGPHQNNLLIVRAADLERLRRGEREDE